jgi:hypothetical protein
MKLGIRKAEAPMVGMLGHRPCRNAGLLVLVALAACAPEREGRPDAPEPAAASAPPPASGPNPTKQPRVGALPDLGVEPNGLRLLNENGVRLLSFGMRREELLAVLESSRSPADGGTSRDCGAGPLDYSAWADGLTLYFQEGRFAGWALDERAAGAHATASGIGPGSTRSALDAAYDAKVEESSLGMEFDAGGLFGVLDGSGPNARVTALWAGVSCVFR